MKLYIFLSLAILLSINLNSAKAQTISNQDSSTFGNLDSSTLVNQDSSTFGNQDSSSSNQPSFPYTTNPSDSITNLISNTPFVQYQTSINNYGATNNQIMATTNNYGFNMNLLNRTIVIDVVTSTIDSKAPTNQLTFRCYTFCSGLNCTLLNGTVDWYARSNGTEQYMTSTDILYSNNRLYSFLFEGNWTAYINQEISCKVKPKFNQNELFNIQSSWYLAGVKCVLENPSSQDSQTTEVISVNVIEGDTTGKIITCTSNLPVTCASGSISSCDLNIYLNYRDTNSYNRIVQKRCNKNNGVYQCEGCNKGFKKNPGNDNSLNKVTWTLSANFESGNLNWKPEVYNIDIFSNKNSTSLRPFWANIQFPYITFTFTPYNRPVYVSSYCFNDPHCKTFDDKYFELHQDGEFLMFENSKLSTRIHLIAKPCNPSWNPNYPYCVNKIYFQAMHEVIKIYNDQKYLLYSNLKTKKFDLPIIWSSNNSATNQMDMFVVTKTDWTLDVASNYGVLLRIYCYTWNDVFYMWGFQVIPSKADVGQTFGLFGNWNGDSSDDIRFLKGSNTVGSSESAVYNSFNALITGNNIPAFSNGQYYGYSNNAYQKSTDDDNEYDNCDCLKTNPAVTIDKCAKGQNQVTFNGNTNSKKNKRSISDYNENVNQLNVESLAESPSVKTLANLDLDAILGNKYVFEQSKLRNVLLRVATTNNESCATSLNGDAALVQCNTKGIINLSNMIDLCVADYNGDPSTDWVFGYLDSAKNKCKFTLTQDSSLMETDANGNKAPSAATQTLLTSLCPNSCSSHGNCSASGICTCDENYSGSDCSLSATESPLLVGSTYTNDMFDYSTSSSSDVLLVVKKFLLDNPNGVVKVSLFTSKTAAVAESNATVSPSSINYNLIYVNLTDISSSFASQGYYFVNLSISNDNTSFSSPLTVLAYNSKSFTCTTDFTCTKVVETSSQSNQSKSGSNILKNSVIVFLQSISFFLGVFSIMK